MNIFSINSNMVNFSFGRGSHFLHRKVADVVNVANFSYISCMNKIKFINRICGIR